MTMTTRHAVKGDKVWIRKESDGRLRWIDYEDDSVEVLLDSGTELEGIVGQHALTIRIDDYMHWTIIEPAGVSMNQDAFPESMFLVTKLP